jgi:hypothetical protein
MADHEKDFTITTNPDVQTETPVPAAPLSDQQKYANLMAGKVTRGEMFELLRLTAEPLNAKLDAVGVAMQFMPYHAIVLSLIIKKLGITDEEIQAHRERCEAEQTALDEANALEQADAQQAHNDAGGGATA